MWMFAGNWTEQILNLIIFVIIARLLGAESFGLAMMAIVVAVFAEFLVRDSISDALISLEQLDRGHIDAVFWFLNIFAVFIVLAVVSLADTVSVIYDEPRVADLLRSLSPTVLLVALSGVPVAMLRRQLKFRLLAMRATAGMILGGAVGITMATMEYGAWSLVGQRLVQVSVNSIIVWIAQPWRPALLPSLRHFQEIRDFGSKMIGVRAAEFFSFQAPSLVIAGFLGPTQFGYYTLALRVVEMLSVFLIVPIRFVAQPVFAMLRSDEAGARELLRDTTLLTALITFPTFAGLAAVAPSVILQVFGPGWEPTIPVLRILCFAGFYLSLARLHQAFLLGRGRAGWSFAVQAAEALLGVVAVLAAGYHGLVAIAAAVTVRYYLIWPMNFIMINRLIGIDFVQYARPLLSIIGACFLMVVAVLLWEDMTVAWGPGILELGSAILVGVIVYAIFVYLAMSNELIKLRRYLRSADV
jgi:PST family polysaccharide transporter